MTSLFPVHASHLPGAPVWIDLLTSDPAQSTDFYGRLLGWTADATQQRSPGYVTFSLNGAVVAGMSTQPVGAPRKSAWTTYLHTTDVDATASAVLAAGGAVVQGGPVGDLGEMLILTDSTGATLGAWRSGTLGGSEVTGRPGSPVWHELHTRDFAEAVRFYERAFAWEPSIMADSPEFRMATLGSGRAAVAGIYDASSTLDAGEPAQWMVYFGVTDADAAATTVEEHGGRLIDRPTDTPFGLLAHAVDPGGAPFALLQAPARDSS